MPTLVEMVSEKEAERKILRETERREFAKVAYEQHFQKYKNGSSADSWVQKGYTEVTVGLIEKGDFRVSICLFGHILIEARTSSLTVFPDKEIFLSCNNNSYAQRLLKRALVKRKSHQNGSH